MASQEQSTQTEQQRHKYCQYFNLSNTNVFKFLSSLILPLMFGIFTVVITFEQQKLARQQRLEDKDESQLQRKQDWTIAQDAQMAQNKAVNDQYQNEVLTDYIKEITELLQENDGLLTNHSLTHTIARVKTLNAIALLDGPRQMRIIRFLYEAGQLTTIGELTALDISTAELFDINFEKISLTGVYLQNCTFSYKILNNVNFSLARFVGSLTQFYRANAPFAIFMKCDCNKIDFTGANLKNSSFYDATLSETIFTLANLQNVDFTKTTVTDTQLQSALSIRNARLPNGTLGQGRNLIKNGNANCNNSLNDYWLVQNGSIIVTFSNKDQNKCQFTLQSVTTGAIMLQRIPLIGIWDSSVWRSSNVELQAQMSSGVSIELKGIDRNGTIVNRRIANSSENNIIMELERDIQELNVIVNFKAHNNENNNEKSWCDDIEMFVNYDKW